MTKILTVLMLTMFSLSASADVKVFFGEKGEELKTGETKIKGNNGTIAVEQKASDDGSSTTIYLTFSPDNGYTISSDNIEVYAVVSTGSGSTRTPEISGSSLKLNEETSKAPEKRYSVKIDSKLGLWVKKAEFKAESKGTRGVNTYYVIHQSGTGYLKVSGAGVNLGNDGTFQSGNLFDKGNCIWCRTSEGYLQNEYFYLNVANNKTLYLSVTPVTVWETEDVTGENTYDKKHLKINDGENDLYLCNDNGITLKATPTAYYNACPVTVTEVSWDTTPYSDNFNLTLQSPQMVTYLRAYFKQKIKYNFHNDAGTEVKSTDGKHERRVYATIAYKEGGTGTEGWAIDASGIIYNTKTSGDVEFTATYNILPADPIARAAHSTAATKDIKYKVSKKPLSYTNVEYLLFSIPGGDSYRYPYDDGIANGNPVKPDGKGGISNQSVLTDPATDKNLQISWTITADEKGFYTFQNKRTGKYLYFDETPHESSDYGTLCVGSSPTENSKKFRLYKTSNNDYGTCYYIIPYCKLFAVYGSNALADGLYAALNIKDYSGKDTKVISLFKPNTNSTWCIYKYEAEYRVKSDFSIKIETTNTAGETGNYKFYSENCWYGKCIKESPKTGNAQLGLVINGSYKDASNIDYLWTVTGLGSNIAITDGTLTSGTWTKTTTGNNNNRKLVINVPSMSASTISGVIELRLSGYSAPNENVITTPDNGKKTVAFTILGNGAVSFTDITSLSQIESSNGAYRLIEGENSDFAYSSTNKPSTTSFTGILEGNGVTISGLSAPLFETMTNGTVRNVNLSGVSIRSHTGPTGAIAGTANGGSRIYNVGILDGSVGSSGVCGGLVGVLDGSARVINCFSYANITGGTDVGGIVGYNNFNSTSSDIRTMVMNCMFYGDITNGTNISPIYGGQIIDNAKGNSTNGLNNYNFYRYESNYSKNNQITSNKYNCALAAEEKYLTHFEFYRLLLNSNKKLAAYYATGSADNANQMAKWVLETADRTISNPKPYPILKQQGKYPSIINYDDANATTLTLVNGKPSETDRNKGGKFGSLSVTISDNTSGKGSRTGSFITTGSTSLPITDKDFEKYNYNYYKVRLPYYNEVGKDNYKDGKVVTGWIITDMDGATQASSGEDIIYNADGTVKNIPFNFADRTCTKDENGDYRVFSQGAYFDVPIGVTEITIKPYWANAAFISDKNLDKTYKNDFTDGTNVAGELYSDNKTYTINGISMKVRNSFSNALTDITEKGNRVYDNAIVLVGNFHQLGVPSSGTDPFTVMSADFDNDNEPDFSLVYHHTERKVVSPIRFDFINILGTAMAQKPNGSSLMCNVGIFQPYKWFEVTNTALIHFGQFEYDYDNKQNAPLILLGGEVDQIVSNNSGNGLDYTKHTQYIHVGSNVWFKEFHNGTHLDKTSPTPHRPISVTGGQYEKFYLSGMYRPDATKITDDAECYINGGKFGEVAGAAQEQINGDVTWIVEYADIDNFYGGGVNAANPITGDINVTIKNSHVDVYCGGPKFGNMSGYDTESTTDDKTVTTNAEGCVFRRFFGAGYGGASYYRYTHNKNLQQENISDSQWGTWANSYINDRGKYISDRKGIATGFEYEYFIGSKGTVWGRFYINYASFSKAITNNVYSNLTGCHITGDFYGGGSLGVVNGTAFSKLDGCTVDGSVFGGGYSGSIPTIDVVSSGFTKNPGYNSKAGLFTPGVISASVPYKWKRGTLSNNSTALGTDTDGTYVITTDQDLANLGQVKDVDLTIKGNTYVKGDIHTYDDDGEIETAKTVVGTGGVFGGGDASTVNGNTVVKIEGTNSTGDKVGVMNVYGGGNTAEVSGNTSVTLQGNSVVRGNVYGGGNVGPVGTITTQANQTGGTDYIWAAGTGVCTVTITGGKVGPEGMDPITVKDKGNVFGAGKGVADSFECDKAMVDSTAVSISGGTVYGSVYGGGEIGRVEHNTGVTIGSADIKGNVFGGGAGVKTHGYSALVRGNSWVTVQDEGKVRLSVYGGGEIASVGKYKVKKAANDPADAPSDLPIGMPYSLVSDNLGICRVAILGKAKITGNVFGAGKGKEPEAFDYAKPQTNETTEYHTNSYEIDNHMPKRMMRDYTQKYAYSEYYDPNNTYIWEYFDTRDKYLKFIETLALSTQTFVTVKGEAEVYGNVYGGSESGFVQHNTSVTIAGGTIGTSTAGGNVFGGGLGLEDYFDAGRVSGSTTININNGTINGTVYGGGELGYIGKVSVSEDMRTFTWTDSEGNTNTTENANNKNTGVCKVTITDGTIKGNVFGAGMGKGNTFWCEKAIAYSTDVSVSGGTLDRNVYGGGEVGRVETNTVVKIGNGDGTEGGSSTPIITGSVFGGGEGLETHGYSALVRGNTRVTVEGNANVGHSVYGGGEIASIGRYALDNKKMPSILQGGGYCFVTVQGYATIGADVFGAGEGVKSHFNQNTGDKSTWSRRMVTYAPDREKNPHTDENKGTLWWPYNEAETPPVFVWEYFPDDSEESGTSKYATYLETLALATHPEVTIRGNASVNGSVYGGGELGITKGSVIVKIQGGSIAKDVYGGGSLANTNTTSSVDSNGDGVADQTVYPTTTVNLTGGTIGGDAYGGGLGQIGVGASAAVYYTAEEAAAYNTEHGLSEGNEGYVTTETVKTPAVAGVDAIPATVYGDITVNLGSSDGSTATAFIITNYDTTHADVVKSGRVFGCNNLYGSPQGNVTVNIWRTVTGKDGNGDDVERTSAAAKGKKVGETGYVAPTYELAAVYGGGNLASYTATGKKASVIIKTCEASIHSVYGGGNAAAVPESDVLVLGAYEIAELFGGGNGKDQYTLDEGGSWTDNPGANVNGNATTLLKGGYIHEAYGGSNSKGTISGDVSIDKSSGGTCTLTVEDLYGAGKDADIEGDLIMVMGCSETRTENVYGCSKNANVKGNVELTITSGEYGRVFGGNDQSGAIFGHIIVNIEETGCTPIIIDELYGCGNDAPYSVYGYYQDGTIDGTEGGKPKYVPKVSATDGHDPKYWGDGGEDDHTMPPYADPEVNIISCTRIGKVFGGGYGANATVYGNPKVNINQIYRLQSDGNGGYTTVGSTLGQIGVDAEGSSEECGVFGGGNQAKVVGNTTINIGTETAVDLHASYDKTNGYTYIENQTVLGANIKGNVYGGGNLADVTGNTFVNICAKKSESGDGYEAVAEGAQKVTIGGTVFGGGKGKEDTFLCEKAMIGENGLGADNPNYPNGNTSVRIGHGTVKGSVYGGGEVGRVEMNTVVEIGYGDGGSGTKSPVIEGNVFGAGKGVKTHGYSALVRGNPSVTIQGDTWVKKSVYGGGEIASVARYNVPRTPEAVQAAIAQGYNAVINMPYALKDPNSGYCYVTIKGNAEVGTSGMKMYHDGSANDKPDDWGHVFAAGKGVLPETYDFEHFSAENRKNYPCRMALYDEDDYKADQENKTWEYVDPEHKATNLNIWEYFNTEDKYFTFVKTLGLATQTNVTIGDDASGATDDPLIYGSVYGGSENGIVQFDTNVYIKSGQIGCGDGETGRYSSWPMDDESFETSWHECAHWEFKAPFAPYDPNANASGNLDKYESGVSTEGGRRIATDGHTYYGNVFGGGSGSVPYYDNLQGKSRYIMSAGQVRGNTNVTITGGHILTNVYGGCEATDVDGTATVMMTNGTIGVPRTDTDIINHPVTGYLFGGGKGDQRVFFNKDTNVKDAVVKVEGGRIYGSVYGGGEDGHVLGNVTMTIGKTGETGPTIGTRGTSYYDGHVFGGGRGFGGEALTAGNVAGSVDLDIKGGTILGSVYGGGRLASVGYGLFDKDENGYGTMRDDSETEEGFNTNGDFTKGRGHIDITISGGTIGNNSEYTYDADNTLTHTKGGNVFAGGMGRMYQLDGTTPISDVDWWKLGSVKSTKLTISGDNTWIKSCVYGGGEMGQVVGKQKNGTVGTEVIINGGTIGTEIKDGETVKYTFGSVFGGGYGSLEEKLTHTGDKPASYPKYIAGRVKGSTKVNMTAGEVKASVYGGGEMAAVGESVVLGETLTEGLGGNTYVTISDGSIGKSGFGGAKMGNVYGGGSGHNNTVRSGQVFGNTNVTINGGTIFHNIYGGGAYGTVGDFAYITQDVNGVPKVFGVSGRSTDHSNSGVATVTITGGTIGVNGKENGMVFGSSRGDVNRPEERDDHTAWVYDANVTIGDANGGPAIKGSIYGSGENGHTFNNAVVTIINGTIGIASGEPIVSNNGTPDDISDDITYNGAAYPYRGNVYGGGCGTDKYYANHDEETHDGNGQLYNPLTGIVYGNATVNINGGTIVRNVYGAGAMGSVGKLNTDGTVTGGTTTINISGGTIGVDGTKGDGNVFGAARGDVDAISNEAALVRKTSNVSITGGTIKGNVYGGGELGCVGVYDISSDYRTFTWKNTDGNTNTAANSDNKNTGICNVIIDGSSTVINGHVFGAGKGKDDTFWCEKGIAYRTIVNVKNGTVNGNVYGGGEVGRVETDTKVKIGDGDGTEGGEIAPTITGSVFGGGAGVETHGYSALVRGNTTVNVEGNAAVGHSVYGGGEIASVGKYGLDAQNMPSILQGGGYCYVTVQGYATIAEDVFGAGKGVTPHFDKDNQDETKRSRRMTLKSGWKDRVGADRFDWNYLTDEAAYSTYLETLALATHPEVTIDGSAEVSGSVFGGGELGLTKGSVVVTIQGGTITEDVYGGGKLANTNTTNSVDTNGDGVADTTVDPTTTLNLYGGLINGDAYGGGLGQKTGFYDANGAIATSDIEATVYGDITVNLGSIETPATEENAAVLGPATKFNIRYEETGDKDEANNPIKVVQSGRVFGCNNLNGSPQGDVTVNVFKTVEGTLEGVPNTRTALENYKKKEGDVAPTYELAAVYGGGNLADYTATDKKASVIIHTCDVSVQHVYGGGNAAVVPETDVLVKGAYEIEHVFGGGNGKDKYKKGNEWIINAGANVSTNTNTLLIGGYIHEAYGGSNEKGTIGGNVTINTDSKDERCVCDLELVKLYGAGKNADIDGDLIVVLDCAPETKTEEIYGGAENANVRGNVELTITSGSFGKVFGGNNQSGAIFGHIILNIEETSCRPIIIDELYGCGNNAAYSVYGYKEGTDADGYKIYVPRTSLDDGVAVTFNKDENQTAHTTPQYADPQVNIISCTSIGKVFGGGYGSGATVYGNPTVNINQIYGKAYDGNAYTATATTLGEIGEVFGGGNEANVVGNTTVNVGTVDKVNLHLSVDKSGNYTMSEDSKDVVGANITGNVYGGGNQAEVTGNTNVNIGRSVTP